MPPLHDGHGNCHTTRAYPWLDTETPIVQAAGRVDVAAANHHGYFDACGPAFAQALDADAYIVQAWHATHPAMETMQRLLNAWPGRQTRDVYVTRLVPESRSVNNRFLSALQSSEGHVVVRVSADGRYRIFVTDSRDESDRIVLAGALKTPKLIRVYAIVNDGGMLRLQMPSSPESKLTGRRSACALLRLC